MIRELDLSDYVMVNFRNETGKSINFYVAYYESQRKGESIHSPASCLPGGGWEFVLGGGVRIPTPGQNEPTMKVNQALMQLGDLRQFVLYWFPQRGRILSNAYQLKWYTFWDALTRQRTDGALVRLITPLYENEKSADANKRLQDFIGEMLPILNEFLPGKDVR